MKNLLLLTVSLALMVTVLPVPALANITFSVDGVSANNPDNIATGESQLFVNLQSYGTNQVLFTFMNQGSPADPCDACYIRGVFFYDGVLLGISSLVDADDGVGGDPNVDFTEDGADPVKTPETGDMKKLVAAYQLDLLDSADQDGAQGSNGWGVDPGEELGVIFDIVPGNDWEDVRDGILDHTIALMMKVQGFYDGGSETFTTNGIIPSPGAALLGGIGIGLVGWLRRRRTL